MSIDLRSDTTTKPTKPMLEAMMQAEVGDDVFGEDPSVIQLEEKAAELFGMEAGLFCPSGTMTNQIAIKVHTQPGNEVICDKTAHMYNYEGGGIAYNALCSTRLMNGDRGRFKAEEVLANINPPDHHYAKTALVCVENTCNKGGGSIYEFEQIQEIVKVSHDNSLKTHLDGARIFNALVATTHQPKELGPLFDSISICLSKGLGAPAGSVVMGNKDFIDECHRIRKVIGGGMRQAGYLAAAGIYALDHHVERLEDDHIRAKVLEEVLGSLPFVKEILPVESNIVVCKLEPQYTNESFINLLDKGDIKAIPFGPQMVRFVTHLDFDDDMLEKVVQCLKGMG